MIKIKKKNPYQIFIDAYGEEAQLDMAIEEMSELTKAICKYKRYFKTADAKEKERLTSDIIEETADVALNIEQLAYMFGKEKVEEMKDYKLQRGLAKAKSGLKENWYELWRIFKN